MYLVAIAWLYVALMMALAEAFHPAGGVLGAVVTFVLYGLAPVALVMYLMGTPMRGRDRKRRELAERLAAQGEPVLTLSESAPAEAVANAQVIPHTSALATEPASPVTPASDAAR